MKLELVTELDKRNTETSETVDDVVMSANYDIIVIFPICAQFGGISKQDTGRMDCIFYIVVNINLLSYKN